MLELAAARLAFFEVERRNKLGVFVRNSKLTGLRRVDDRLVNGDQVEVRKASAQLQRMALGKRKISRLRKPEGEFFAEILKERWNAPDQGGEIFAGEALEAYRLAGADQVLTGKVRQDFDVAEDVSPREIGLGRLLAWVVLDDFYHPTIDDVQRVAGIAG